jgi:hypothetical protein
MSGENTKATTFQTTKAATATSTGERSNRSRNARPRSGLAARKPTTRPSRTHNATSFGSEKESWRLIVKIQGMRMAAARTLDAANLDERVSERTLGWMKKASEEGSKNAVTVAVRPLPSPGRG